MLRALYLKPLLILGWISLFLGIVGAFLPLLPTTVFILISAYCFGRSSPKSYEWLISNKTFGPTILAWQSKGAIPKEAKRIAVISISICFSLTALLSVHSPLFLSIFLLFGACLIVFIVSRPTA